MVTLAVVRRHAMTLPEVTEEPHHDLVSWRVRGKIFATVPPEPHRLRLFVDEGDVRDAVARDPAAFEELWWGKRLSGVAVSLDKVSADDAHELVDAAWRRRAPASLAREYDAR